MPEPLYSTCPTAVPIAVGCRDTTTAAIWRTQDGSTTAVNAPPAAALRQAPRAKLSEATTRGAVSLATVIAKAITAIHKAPARVK